MMSSSIEAHTSNIHPSIVTLVMQGWVDVARDVGHMIYLSLGEREEEDNKHSDKPFSANLSQGQMVNPLNAKVFLWHHIIALKYWHRKVSLELGYPG